MDDCQDTEKNCVANMSLGGGVSSLLNQAVANAVDAGVTMVVAAGNDRYDACEYSPGSEPKAITVGSTTIDDEHSWFSNYGPCVDVYGPGSDIQSAMIGSPDNTATWSGTSMASPREFSLQVLFPYSNQI
jgi:subtilisin family serine protease